MLHVFSPTGTRLDLAVDKILSERTSPLPLPKSFDLYSVSEKKSSEQCVTDAGQAQD